MLALLKEFIESNQKSRILKKIPYFIKHKIYTKMGLNYRALGKKYRKEPIEIWAFIRAKNEIMTIEASLNSILPVIKKGIIGYNKLSEEKDDGTEEFILKFCKKNPGFIPYRYEYNVIPANDERYKNFENIAIENRLDSYYNAVLRQIPKDVWMMKIDCDHIFDVEKFVWIPYLVKEETDMISFSRLNFHYENGELYFINIHTISAAGDWLLLKNSDLVFKFKSGYRKDGSFFAWEYLDKKKEGMITRKNLYYTDLFNWHFPFMKKGKYLEPKYFTKFDNFRITDKMKREFHIPLDMLEKEKIMSICKGFHINEEGKKDV